MKISKIFALAAVFCTVLATSCTKETPVPTAMSLDKTTVDIFVGQTACVTPEFTPSNAKATSLVWTSSDDKVATVNGGYVKGIKAGTATITGKAQGTITATCTVTVKNIDPTKFEITPTEMTLIKNSDSQQITYVLEPSNVTLNAVTFTSSDENVATVDNAGNVSPVEIGTATITVKLEAGLTKTCSVVVKQGKETLDVWKSYDAGSRELYGFAADEGKSAGEGGWLYWSNGIVNWKANTTGASRTATLELASGSKITVKQVDAVDFMGSYELTSKRFSNATSVKTAGNPVGTDALTFGSPILGETLEDFDGVKHTNQIGITGLYLEAVADACVEIDYEAKSVKIGIFLDARDNAQKVSTAFKGKEYVCFLPEMGGSAFGSPWNFIQVDLDSAKDYCWLWFTGDETNTVFTYNASVAPQKMTGDKADATANTIIGITVAASSEAKVTSTTVLGANAIGANAGNYPIIYQGNPNNAGAQYTITRK